MYLTRLECVQNKKIIMDNVVESDMLKNNNVCLIKDNVMKKLDVKKSSQEYFESI